MHLFVWIPARVFHDGDDEIQVSGVRGRAHDGAAGRYAAKHQMLHSKFVLQSCEKSLAHQGRPVSGEPNRDSLPAPVGGGASGGELAIFSTELGHAREGGLVGRVPRLRHLIGGRGVQVGVHGAVDDGDLILSCRFQQGLGSLNQLLFPLWVLDHVDQYVLVIKHEQGRLRGRVTLRFGGIVAAHGDVMLI